MQKTIYTMKINNKTNYSFFDRETKQTTLAYSDI